MNPRSTRLLVGFAAVLSSAGFLSACGGDDDVTDALSAAEQADDASDDASDTDTDSSLPDVDLDDVELPDNLPISDECTAVYQQFVLAMSGASGGTYEGLETAMASLSESVPDDLDDDVQILSAAYGQMADLLAEYDGDIAAAMADPANQAQMAAIGSPEVSAASDAIGEYFEETCPELGS
jgi:hypothetical protein